MKHKNITIIGGGASGMAAAITASRMGSAVTIVEQKERLGKKLLATGNGRCNFTNTLMAPSYFCGEHPEIVEDVLLQFGVNATLQFFGSLGVMAKDQKGYIYPRTGQAATILEALEMELRKLKVRVLLETTVQSTSKQDGRFLIQTNHEAYQSDALILATGGKASSVLGSDGSGYALAESFGHTISPVVPALVQLKSGEKYFKQIAGVRADAMVTAIINGCKGASAAGELQLTKLGISGIPVFQISRYIAKALYEKKNAVVETDFLPAATDEEFRYLLNERIILHKTKTVREFFNGIFHQKLNDVFLQKAGISPAKQCSTLTKADIETFIRICKHFQVPITETNGFDQAQVCAGGVRTKEVHTHNMESKYTAGLFLTGELLDIDGICGGYNLQWAWSTGCLAGIHAAAKENI